jgi:hypothetical protein
MKKHTLLIISFLLLFCCLSFAAEEITLSTYYPAPYGTYDELQAYRLSVGDTNTDGILDANDMPTQDGQIYTARSIILKPQTGALSSPVKGELVYNNSDNSLYLYDGSSWVQQGGGSSGGCYTNYGSSTCASGWTRVVSGYTTFYYIGGTASMQLACSSIPHLGVPATYHSFGSSVSLSRSMLDNEPCAICCK